jgi:hypothetical protein
MVNPIASQFSKIATRLHIYLLIVHFACTSHGDLQVSGITAGFKIYADAMCKPSKPGVRMAKVTNQKTKNSIRENLLPKTSMRLLEAAQTVLCGVAYTVCI